MSTKKPASRRARASDVPPMVAEPVDRQHLVEIEAYLIAEARGFAPGQELADWLEAERRVASRLAITP